MEVLVAALIQAAIELGNYLATLPEQDRQKAIEQLRGQKVTTSLDRQALVDELDALKKAHEALKAQIAAQPPQG